MPRHWREAVFDGPIEPGVGKVPALALIRPKYPHNVGAAVRAASCFGVEQVWFTGNRVNFAAGPGRKMRLPREERMRGYKDVTLCHGERPLDGYFRGGCTPVAVELIPGAEPLTSFEHPADAVYVFGPEDGSVSREYLELCHRFVHIPMRHCANLASSAYVVLYDRHAKRVAAGLEPPLRLAEERGWPEPDRICEETSLL